MRQYSYNVEPHSPYLIRSECMELSHAGDDNSKEKIRKLAITLSDLDLRVYDFVTSSEIKPTSLSNHHMMCGATFNSHDPYDHNDGHSDFFRHNYEKIVHGEMEDWILCGIGLWYNRIKFQYCDCSIDNPVDRKKREGTVYFWQPVSSTKSIHLTARVPLSDSNTYEKYEFWWFPAGWKFRNGVPGSNFDILETSATGDCCTLEYSYNEGSQKYSCTIYQGVHITDD